MGLKRGQPTARRPALFGGGPRKKKGVGWREEWGPHNSELETEDERDLTRLLVSPPFEKLNG